MQVAGTMAGAEFELLTSGIGVNQTGNKAVVKFLGACNRSAQSV